MTKKTVTQPVPTVQPQGDIADEAQHATDHGNVAILPTGRTRNAINERATEKAERLAAKVRHLSEARGFLTDARALHLEGEDFASDAQTSANKGAMILYQDRLSGVLTADEVSGILGDVFGYKPKNDGTPGKTPAGLGEPVRKRIVRAVSAAEYATSGDDVPAPTFFKGLDKGDVAQIVNELDNGNIGLWDFYRKSADLKSAASQRVNPAFDPRRILAMAEALSEPAAIGLWLKDARIEDAYATLVNVLAIVGSNPAVLEARDARQAAAA